MKRTSMWIAAICAIMALGAAEAADAEPIQVVVWDEQQPEQEQAYDGGYLGDYIAEQLARNADMEVRSVNIDDDEQGLSDEVLDNCDVLIWWGHVRHREIDWETAERIAERVENGDFALLPIHSAHFAKPFIASMFAVTRRQALADVATRLEGDVRIEIHDPEPALYTGLAGRDLASPDWELVEEDGQQVLHITMPNCVFPAVRADGKPARIETQMPDHPIAAGIPSEFIIEETEMYDEPFYVPEPDALIFDEHFEEGEYFRAGLLWDLGDGQVFYFRPGHETYPVFKQALPMRIIENATRYMGQNIQAGS